MAPEFQRDRTAGAVADGGHPVGIDPRFGTQHVERRMADVPHPVGVGEQRHATGQHLLGVAQVAPAVEVEGQCHVPQLGQGLGSAALDVAEPHPLRPDQNRGPAARTGGKRQVPDHREGVSRVFNRTRYDRLHEAER